jgi:segregation and condensation protein A
LALNARRRPLPRGDFLVIELDRFQGPLDLLLHLIRQQDIDIFDIPIAAITDQFLAAVEGIQADDLDGAGEFLEMAATLIRIKAQMLLPRPADDEEEDPRAELVRRLLEYEQIREIASRMSRAEAERARRFGKGYVEPRPQAFQADTPLETTWDEVMALALALELPHPLSRAHRLTTGFVALEEKIQLILETLEGVSRVEFSHGSSGGIWEPWQMAWSLKADACPPTTNEGWPGHPAPVRGMARKTASIQRHPERRTKLEGVSNRGSGSLR